jgi:hypothetical protein
MPIAMNDDQLMALLLNDLLAVGKSTGEDLTVLVQQAIFDKVYSFPKGKYYERRELNGGFVGSWISESGLNGTNVIDTSVFSDPYMMDLEEGEYVHGSEEFGDQRPFMSEDIIEAKNYNLGGNAMIERDFWQPVEEALAAGEIEKDYEAEMSRRGLNWKKV